MNKMREEMKSRDVADAYKWWTFLATDTVDELSFGETPPMLELGKVDSLHSPEEDGLADSVDNRNTNLSQTLKVSYP